MSVLIARRGKEKNSSLFVSSASLPPSGLISLGATRYQRAGTRPETRYLFNILKYIPKNIYLISKMLHIIINLRLNKSKSFLVTSCNNIQDISLLVVITSWIADLIIASHLKCTMYSITCYGHITDIKLLVS